MTKVTCRESTWMLSTMNIIFPPGTRKVRCGSGVGASRLGRGCVTQCVTKSGY